MNTRRTRQKAPRVGLVIRFPSTVRGLFNPSIHRLVRSVEDRLGGVFVTYALDSGVSPGVADAVAASRFAGCDSVVVVHLDEWLESVPAVQDGADTLWDEAAALAVWSEAADTVVQVFRGLRSRTELAA